GEQRRDVLVRHAFGAATGRNEPDDLIADGILHGVKNSSADFGRYAVPTWYSRSNQSSVSGSPCARLRSFRSGKSRRSRSTLGALTATSPSRDGPHSMPHGRRDLRK